MECKYCKEQAVNSVTLTTGEVLNVCENHTPDIDQSGNIMEVKKI